jgi:predicted transcriptional regulator
MNIKETMIRTGYKDNEAEVIDYIYHHDNATSREIEQQLAMRQPIASIILSKYTDKKWVQETQTKNRGKGRPTKHYTIQEHIIREDIRRAVQHMMSQMKIRHAQLEMILTEISDERTLNV